jgi:NAD(P)-dependent dehydrogenase (short-subunit alcohol dehydrogenase family)
MSSRSENPVAFVTGASRGIGKACALYLAGAGYDVAISARTVNPGEAREHSSTVAASNTKPLPGSLSETAALVEECGRKALMVPADLLDHASLEAAAKTLLGEWGRVDVLVHNGRYVGPGHMDRFLDTPLDLIEKQIQGNVMSTLVLNKALLPTMLEQGGGTLVNMVSASGYSDPGAAAGDGGWGMGYGVSKGAMQRIAGFLHVEHFDQGLRAYNVQPGFIATERIAADMGEFGFDMKGAPPDLVAAVVAWLATHDEAPQYSGTTIEAQFFCHERGLLPDWPGPTPNENKLTYDTAGADLQRYEEELLKASAGG